MPDLEAPNLFSLENYEDFSWQTCNTSLDSQDPLTSVAQDELTQIKPKNKLKFTLNRIFTNMKSKNVRCLSNKKERTSDSGTCHDDELLRASKAQNKLKFSAQSSPIHHVSLLEHSMATIRSASFRRNKHTSSSHIQLLDESWEDWLEKYQKGEKNLSEIGRPTCFNGFGHMAPPIYPLETARLKLVAKVSAPQIWDYELSWLETRMQEVCARYRLKSATLSLIQKTAQHIIWQTGMYPVGDELRYLSRDLSLDAHTILSHEYFAILDCSSDWRTKLNPLVHGPPFIKFYCGVPVMIDGMPIGCIAVSDPYLKSQVMPTLVEELTKVSEHLARELEIKINHKPEYGLRRIQWDDNVLSNIPTYADYDVTRDAQSESSVSENSSATSSPPFIVSPSLSHLQNSTSSSSLIYRPIGCKSVLQPFEVFESLLKCQSINQAIKKACKLVKQNLGADVVYLAEIRSSQNIVDSSLRGFSRQSSITKTIALSELEKTGEKLDFYGDASSKVKLVGNCRPAIEIEIEEFVQFQSRHLQSSVSSRYGLQFLRNPLIDRENGGDWPIQAGILIPLRRTEPFISINSGSTRLICGGYVMAAVVSDQRQFSPGDQAFMKKVVRALENILTCHDEVAVNRESQY